MWPSGDYDDVPCECGPVETMMMYHVNVAHWRLWWYTMWMWPIGDYDDVPCECGPLETMMMYHVNVAHWRLWWYTMWMWPIGDYDDVPCECGPLETMMIYHVNVAHWRLWWCSMSLTNVKDVLTLLMLVEHGWNDLYQSSVTCCIHGPTCKHGRSCTGKRLTLFHHSLGLTFVLVQWSY